MNRHLKSFIAIGLGLGVMAGMPTCGCSKGGDEPEPATSTVTPAPAKGAAEVKSEVPPRESVRPVVIIDTTMGVIKAELWTGKTPGTVKNFLQYVDEGYYDGLIFHRVIPGFMIQGGLTRDLRPKPTLPPIRNEAAPELRNDRGTLAMARTNDPHSATSQFFINIVDNHGLNHRQKTPRGYGYCAFGKVIEGMSVVDEIAKVRTTTVGPHGNVPAEPVVIKSIRKAD